jgi:hypothetical protein
MESEKIARGMPYFLAILPLLKNRAVTKFPKMESIDQSIQLWTRIQQIGIPLIAAIAGSIFYLYTQNRIDGYQSEKSKIEKSEQEQKAKLAQIEKNKSAKSGKINGGKITRYEGTDEDFIITFIVGNVGFSDFYGPYAPDGFDLEDEWLVKQFMDKPPPSDNILPIPIKAKIVNKETVISMTITSADGKIVGVIVDNEWEINPSNYFRRNYDSAGIEVMDPEGLIKVAVDFEKSTGRIFVHGVMYSNGEYIVMPSVRHQGKLPLTESTRRIKADKKTIEKISRSIPNLFRYPAEEHFGERTEIPKRPTKGQ